MTYIDYGPQRGISPKDLTEKKKKKKDDEQPVKVTGLKEHIILIVLFISNFPFL